MTHRTALTRKSLSAPALWLCQQDILYQGVNGLDYGCGKGFDADFFGMAKYDPCYSPVQPTRKFDLVLCNYVLNVVTEEEQTDIIQRVRFLLNTGGVAYFAVRRDIPETGTKTQRYVKLNMPSLYHRQKRFQIYYY